MAGSPPSLEPMDTEKRLETYNPTDGALRGMHLVRVRFTPRTTPLSVGASEGRARALEEGNVCIWNRRGTRHEHEERHAV
jgi:hypothetical protein